MENPYLQLDNLMSCLDSSAHTRSVMEATPLHPKFCVLNFELPGQFKKNNLPRTPYET
jgi:hypothetical protein